MLLSCNISHKPLPLLSPTQPTHARLPSLEEDQINAWTLPRTRWTQWWSHHHRTLLSAQLISWFHCVFGPEVSWSPTVPTSRMRLGVQVFSPTNLMGSVLWEMFHAETGERLQPGSVCGAADSSDIRMRSRLVIRRSRHNDTSTHANTCQSRGSRRITSSSGCLRDQNTSYLESARWTRYRIARLALRTKCGISQNRSRGLRPQLCLLGACLSFSHYRGFLLSAAVISWSPMLLSYKGVSSITSSLSVCDCLCLCANATYHSSPSWISDLNHDHKWWLITDRREDFFIIQNKSSDSLVAENHFSLCLHDCWNDSLVEFDYVFSTILSFSGMGSVMN